MSVAKMSGQSLRTEVGILSIGDDLAGTSTPDGQSGPIINMRIKLLQ